MAHASRARLNVFQATAPPAPHKIRKKLFGGRETAFEVHRKHAWTGGRCYRCGDRDIVIKLSYATSPFDVVRYYPTIAAQLIEDSEEHQLPIWQSKYGPMVWFWGEFACPAHQKECEREAAKLPDYILVEIDRGPAPDVGVFQVPL